MNQLLTSDRKKILNTEDTEQSYFDVFSEITRRWN